MTKESFGKWLETSRKNHKQPRYEELLAVALKRLGGNHADADDALQTALLSMMESPEFAKRNARTLWPWAAEIVRSSAYHSRRSQQRATAAQQDGGGLLQEGKRSKRTPYFSDGRKEKDGVPGPRDGRTALPAPEPVEAIEPGAFAGPSGPKGEISLAHIGPCKCRLPQTIRIERGKDVDRRKVNGALAGRLLSLLNDGVKDRPEGGPHRFASYLIGNVILDSARGATEHYLHQVLGCWNGHRLYTGAYRADNFIRQEMTPMNGSIYIVAVDGSISLQPARMQCHVPDGERKPSHFEGAHEHAKWGERRACGSAGCVELPPAGFCRHGLRLGQCAYCAPLREEVAA